MVVIGSSGSYRSTLTRPVLDPARGRRGPRGAGAARRRGRSSAPAARRPRRTRAGRPGVAVVEAEEGADRRLEVGRPRRAQQHRVGVAGEALRLGQAERVRGGHVRASGASENQKRPFVPGTKGRTFRGATLIRRCRTFLTDGSVLSTADRRCPAIAGALRRSLLGPRLAPPRSVRRLPGPFPVAAAPVSTSHRVSLPTRDGYSSRSMPVFVMWPGV